MSQLRNKPTGRYIGLTIILSNPSRFDKIITGAGGKTWINLLSANGGVLFDECIQPDFNKMMCDVRLMECNEPFMEGTKCILLLGQSAMHKFCPQTKDNTLNEMRGSLLKIGDIPAIASYFPQDAADFKNYEAQLNEDSKDYDGDDEVSSDDEDEGDVKRFSKTKRSNYYFWLQADIRKCKALLGCPINNCPDRVHKEYSQQRPVYRIYPPADEVINILTKTKNEYFYFDMETDYEEQNLLCFAFTFDGRTIYSVPILTNDYRPAYSSYHFIMRALAIAIRDNTIVAHNGASFDFFVFAFKYHIPVGRCYDTMLAMHRCFPCVEKSLGHCTSYWTWEPFHKDSDSRAYFTREHMMEKLKYCGKDVSTMYLIKQAIDAYAKTIPGLEASIKCANDSIVPYLLMSLQGICFEEEARQKIMQENDRLMMQYMRIINWFIGDKGRDEIASYIKGKCKSFPGSNKQCCVYFHDILGYPVLFRSTKTGNPSLGKKIMYRLALKYPNNPVITLVLAYRKVQKETGALKFIPWKDGNGRVYVPPPEQGVLL